VLLLCPELYAPLRSIGQQFHASTDGLAAAERILAIVDQPAALTSAPAGSAPSAAVPDPAVDSLRFQAVSFAYPDRQQLVLDRVDLALEPGSQTVLIGPSGVGKSTIAALALRLVDPTTGVVSCGGVDLRALAPDAWRRQVAWVPQRTRLFSGTIAENIALGTPQAIRARIRAAAIDAGLEGLLAVLPAGLDTRVGDGGRGVSAGQAQRIGLARAFLRDAPLVILDEPTAHLDADTAGEIGTSIERLSVGRTTLLITHDERLAARAGQVIALPARTADPPSLAPVPVSP
jgi:ABC-type multidrug transport system fused ATPase/permease subunit